MSDFEIVSKDAEVDTCYGLETFYVTKEEIAAILSGKKLYSTVNCGEYAITIEIAESEDKDEIKSKLLKEIWNDIDLGEKYAFIVEENEGLQKIISSIMDKGKSEVKDGKRLKVVMVICPNRDAVYEWERLLKTYPDMWTNVKRNHLSMTNMITGTTYIFRSETESQRVLLGFHGDVISIDEFRHSWSVL